MAVAGSVTPGARTGYVSIPWLIPILPFHLRKQDEVPQEVAQRGLIEPDAIASRRKHPDSKKEKKKKREGKKEEENVACI